MKLECSHMKCSQCKVTFNLAFNVRAPIIAQKPKSERTGK